MVANSSKRSDLNIIYLTNKEVREDIIGLNHNIIDKKYDSYTSADVNLAYGAMEQALQQLKEQTLAMLKAKK